MWKPFILSCVVVGQMFFGQVALADPSCMNWGGTELPATVKPTANSLKVKINEGPSEGLVDSFRTSVCKAFFKTKPNNDHPVKYAVCLKDPDLNLIPSSSHHQCTHFVKLILEYMFGIDFGNLYAGKETGKYLQGFTNVYDAKTSKPPGPEPKDRLEVRVYSGGKYHDPKCGKEACGHVEICFMGACLSDYQSDRPIDIVEDDAGRDKYPHVLQGIYVMNPDKPLPLVEKK